MGLLSSLATPKAVLMLGGWRASGFALLALCVLAWGGVSRWQLDSARDALALSEARVSVLEAEKSAAQQLANDYQARADRAVAESEAAALALAESEKQRREDWARIRQQEKAWAETKVPEPVVEALK